MGDLVDHEKRLQDCLLWNTIPGTSMEQAAVESFLQNMANATEKCDEQLEQIKGVIKSRKW